MTNQLEAVKEWLADLNKIIDKTDNECTKEKRDVLEWLVESVEELERRFDNWGTRHIEVKTERNRYKQALEFYAEERNYKERDFGIIVQPSIQEGDRGNTARKALECDLE